MISTVLRTSAARRTAALVLAASAFALTGCSATNPVTTNQEYAASDGVDARLGELEFGNLLVLTAEQGAPGTVLGSVTNHSERSMTVQIGLADDATSMRVPAGGTLLLSPENTAVDLAGVPAPPGALVELVLGSDTEGSTSLQAPVLDGTLKQYASLVPTA